MLEETDGELLAARHGVRAELLESTLRLRAEAYSATGDEGRADLDRTRRRALLEARG